MKKPEDPGKVVIVHHPPQPDTTQPKSQSNEESPAQEDAAQESVCGGDAAQVAKIPKKK